MALNYKCMKITDVQSNGMWDFAALALIILVLDPPCKYTKPPIPPKICKCLLGNNIGFSKIKLQVMVFLLEHHEGCIATVQV